MFLSKVLGIDDLGKRIDALEKKAIKSMDSNKALSQEIIWAEIFNSTITESSWLKDKSFSPGRWAVGYQYLYALYRILDISKPKNILELGLGQTTHMITQYAMCDDKVDHTVVEHDEAWISFCRKRDKYAPNTDICRLDIVYDGIYREDREVVQYSGFREKISGRKFDLISVDGPFGFMAKTYARTDILPLLPDCLSESFVIMIDDSERTGEINTINEIKRILDESSIKYEEGVYKGLKWSTVIASEDQKFLCSM